MTKNSMLSMLVFGKQKNMRVASDGQFAKESNGNGITARKVMNNTRTQETSATQSEHPVLDISKHNNQLEQQVRSSPGLKNTAADAKRIH